MLGLDPSIVNPPSSYIPNRIFGCIFDDGFGLAVRDTIGIDQITFETDYPHMDSTWPVTASYVGAAFDALTDEEVDKVVRSNAIKLFELQEALPTN